MNMNDLAETKFPTEAVARLFEQYERDERRHYEECSPRERRGHIYNSIRQLRDWFDLTITAKERKAAEEAIAADWHAGETVVGALADLTDATYPEIQNELF